jgi:hypothetical protein
MKLLEECGDRLVCVRYRYDKEARKRYTTVELTVHEAEWQPSAERSAWVRVDWGERELAIRVKRAGGRWDKSRKLWEVPLEKVRTLGLESRVVTPSGV